jgi:putative lipoprotein
MKASNFRTVVAAASALLASLMPVAAQAAGKITGTVSYRARIALPPRAVVLVSLRDVSLQDAPSVEISSVELRPTHQSPLPFVLRYDRRRIVPAHTYSVSARIAVDGRLAFISTRMYPVLTRGGARHVDIVVEPVGRRPD